MSPLRRTLVACLAVAAAGASPAAASATPTWTTEPRLSEEGSQGTDPRVAIAADGDVIVAWREHDGSDERVRSAMWSPAAGWSAAVDLSVPASGVQDLSIAVDRDGGRAIAWTETRDTDVVVQAAIGGADGSWSSPSTLSSPGGSAAASALSSPAPGTYVAAWAELDGSTNRIASARWAAGSWGSAQWLSAATVETVQPQLAALPGGEVTATWVAYEGGPGRIESASSAAGATTWTAPVVLSDPATEAYAASLVSNTDGSVDVTWAELDGSLEALRSARRDPDGSWSSPEAAYGPTPATASALEPSVGGPGDGRLTVLLRRTTGGVSTPYAIDRDGAGTWSAPELLSSVDTHEPQVAVASTGAAVAAWGRHTMAGSEVQARYRPDGGSWSAPAQLNDSALSAYGVRVTADAAGHAVVVWFEMDGTQRVRAARLDPVAPVLESVEVPESVVAGEAATFTAEADDAWSAGVAVEWSFGDGETAGGAQASHTYAAPGDYTVEVVVRDAAGNTTTEEREVTVIAPTPTLTPAPTPGPTATPALTPAPTPAPTPTATPRPEREAGLAPTPRRRATCEIVARAAASVTVACRRLPVDAAAELVVRTPPKSARARVRTGLRIAAGSAVSVDGELRATLAVWRERSTERDDLRLYVAAGGVRLVVPLRPLR